jgi:hypothetical protein
MVSRISAGRLNSASVYGLSDLFRCTRQSVICEGLFSTILASVASMLDML